MNRYAASIKDFGETFERAREYAAAFEKSKVKRIELSFFPFVDESEQSKIHGVVSRDLKAAGTVEFAKPAILLQSSFPAMQDLCGTPASAVDPRMCGYRRFPLSESHCTIL